MRGNDALLVDGMEGDDLKVAQGENMIEFGPLPKNRNYQSSPYPFGL